MNSLLPKLHQLALPLPALYHHKNRDGYSFFEAGSTDDFSSREYDCLNRYLDDLCMFLKDTRLIQRHPEKFFCFIRGDDWRHSTSHLDGEEIKAEELRYTVELCNTFRDLFADEEDELTAESVKPHNMAALRDYMRSGPPVTDNNGRGLSDAPGLAGLHRFYATTRALMLTRRRDDPNTVASTTLCRDGCAHGHQVSGKETSEERRQRILKFVLSFGMSPKKQHEVGIMRGAIAGLVKCCGCRDCPASGSAPISEPRSVINIGEGKGYVSRTLALCDGLQVVGIDCNPAHKEKAVERVDRLLHASISLRDGDKGKDMTNLFYQERGHVASVVCRLGDAVDWASLLRGHIRAVDDVTHHTDEIDAVKEEVESDAIRDNASVIQSLQQRLGGDKSGVREGPTHSNSVKGKCRVCGKVVRIANRSLLLKHVHHHLNAGGGEELTTSGIPTKTQADEWNLALSQRRYTEKLTTAFFTQLTPSFGSHGDTLLDGECSVASDDVASESNDELPALTRSRADDDAVTGKRVESSFLRSQAGLSPIHLPRGARALTLRFVDAPHSSAGTGDCAVRGAENTAGQSRNEDLAQEALTAPVPTRCRAVLQREYITVCGYDDASGCHIVVGDQHSRREPHTLLMGRVANCLDEAAVEGVMQKGDPESRAAVVLRVLPFAKVVTPAVSVPSLRNTVMIGLHPCGDLGSNVCRQFAKTESQGLLLVSCCWHALTANGFPLSNALKRRGMTVEKVSLLLATQPLDMWATASAEGHKSSAKILFFRSLLGVLWARWGDAYHAAKDSHSSSAAAPGCEDGCTFAPLPHLEPSFLRKVAKLKEELRFPSFVNLVLESYLLSSTSKSTPFTWQNHVCEHCRRAQETFLKGDAASAILSDVVNEYCRSLFSSFLGLTVLRMWMCHLVESVLLLDRALYLHEVMVADGASRTAAGSVGSSSAVSLVPLFDGAISPRMYGIFAKRL